MEPYLIIANVVIFTLFILYKSVKIIIVTDKLLPKDIKYRYKLPVRIKAMFIGIESLENKILETDRSYFIAFNHNYRNFIESILKAFLLFGLITLLILTPSIYYLLIYEKI